MKRTITKDNTSMIFTNWYSRLNYLDKLIIKEKIIQNCMLEEKDGRCYKFENWVYGRTVPENIYKHLINTAAGKPVYELQKQAA